MSVSWLIAVCLTALLQNVLVLTVHAATHQPFMCGTTSVCNLERDQPDQYCTSGPEGRCKYCSDEHSRCFTRRMAFNCTNYCRESYTQDVLKREREKPCPALGNVTNGHHNATDSPQPGDSIQITCHIGYHVHGRDVIRCHEYGVWSDILPDCQIDKTCPALGNVTKGDHNASVSSRPGDRVHTKCNTGYRLEGSEVITCLEHGVWSGGLPRCTLDKICPALDKVTNGHHNSTNSTRPGDSVQLICHDGYHVDGHDVINCLEIGVWSRDLPDCKQDVSEKSCTALGKITHGRHNASDYPRPGENVHTTCDFWYRVEGSNVISCHENGVWSGYLPICKLQVWMVVACVLIVALCICILSWLVRRQIRRRNTVSHVNKTVNVEYGVMDEQSTHANEGHASMLREVVASEAQRKTAEERNQQADDLSPRSLTTYPVVPEAAPPSHCESRHPDDLSSTQSNGPNRMPLSDRESPTQRQPTSRTTSSDYASSGGNRSDNIAASHGNINVNINLSNINNNDNHVHYADNMSATRRSNPDPEEDVNQETHENAPYPTQATEQDTGRTDSWEARSMTNTDENVFADTDSALDNRDTDISFLHADPGSSNSTDLHVQHVPFQPADDTNQGKLALPDNTVPFDDVNRL